MITLVDSNILIDIFTADSKYGITSAHILRQCFKEGAVHACEVVWIEVGALFSEEHQFTKEMNLLGIEYSSIEYATALKASAIWRTYRSKSGKKERVVADFMIGAHALLQGDQLCTRDYGFYRDYFKGLTILDPSHRG